MKEKYILFIALVIISCSRDDSQEEKRILSDANYISTFQLQLNGELQLGEIDQDNQTITFNTAGADLINLIPTIKISDKASIKPDPQTPQDFSTNIAYTIYAENGEAKIYRIIINNRPLNIENKILSFSVEADGENLITVIDEVNKIISINAANVNISNLTPNITVSERATLSPNTNAAQNFNNIVEYNVTSESGETNKYRVIANLPKIESLSGVGGTSKFYTEATVYVSGEFLDLNISDNNILLSNGIIKFPITPEDVTINVYEKIKYVYFNFKIPLNVSTSSEYFLVFESKKGSFKSITPIDIKAENKPVVHSFSQEVYSYNDILEIRGENLYPEIGIPYKGSIYLFTNLYDIATVNEDKSVLKVKIKNISFYAQHVNLPPRSQDIIIYGPERRVSKTVSTLFY